MPPRRPGLLAGAGRAAPSRQNVAALSASVSAALLAQFVSLTAHPAGRGAPAALRYLLAPHHLEHLMAKTGAYCSYEHQTALGDHRTDLTRPQTEWRRAAATRHRRTIPLRLRGVILLKRLLQRTTMKL